jgi:hypothetical protein
MSWLSGFGVSAALMGACGQPASLAVVDGPETGRIHVVNRANSRVVLYYDYVASFGGLQMFQTRFRDRRGALVPITDASGAWFTPHMRYASLRWPRRRRLTFPPGGSLEFSRNIASAVSWASWNRPVDGPCEVQLKLFGYLESRGARSVESLSDWHPGPCLGQSR